MSDSSAWPKYPTGPREAIFCIGMMSINFGELCSVFEYIFSAIFDLDLDGGRMIVSKIGADASIDLATRRLVSGNALVENSDLIQHFLQGYERCIKNRNQFLHSELAHIVQDNAFFVKPSRQGNMIGIIVPIEGLRECADAMKTFSDFGRAVINANGWATISEFIENAPNVSPFSLPEKPALPQPRTFQAGPLPL